MVDNAGSSRQVENAKRLERERVKQERQDIVDLWNLPAFRRFAWRSLESDAVFHTTYSPDAHQMYFNTGRRERGLEFLAILTLAVPDALATLMRERAIDEKQNAPPPADDVEVDE